MRLLQTPAARIGRALTAYLKFPLSAGMEPMEVPRRHPELETVLFRAKSHGERRRFWKGRRRALPTRSALVESWVARSGGQTRRATDKSGEAEDSKSPARKSDENSPTRYLLQLPTFQAPMRGRS
mmetsp:Transcript_16128/g.41481  ORF Transcript_16128/g.41481 Transcript_16128/m.41481 type:complete len:125 (-) Transcript_16128:199-573(-)